MRIVVMDRRSRQRIRPRYTLDIQIDYKSLSDNIPVTPKAIEHYKQTKTLIYATFKDLTEADIASILSAVKRQEADVNVNRIGHCAYYRLLKY